MARWASWNGGGGISVRCACWALIQAKLRENHVRAARTSALSANREAGAGRLVCGMPTERAGMAQRITQRRTGFTEEFRPGDSVNGVRPPRRGLGLLHR